MHRRMLRLAAWVVAATAAYVALSEPNHPYGQGFGLLLAGATAAELIRTRKADR